MQYSHTQRAPLHFLLHVPAVGIAVAAVLSWEVRPVALPLLGLSATFFLLGFMFANLTVRDAGERLEVRFGPLPLFGTRIPYDSIASVEAGRSTWIDGWGIHWIPGRGTTYNLWGFDCVVLQVDGKTVRIGTDDVQMLVSFLRARVDDRSTASTASTD